MQVYNSLYNNPYYSKKNTPSFNSHQTIQAATVKSERGIEYGMRIIGNKLTDMFQPRTAKEITQNIAALTPRQDKLFLEQLAEIGRLYATQKIINVNTEDNILETIAQDKKPNIFIMNHCNQNEDPQMLAVLNTLLAEAYKETGAETFPLPKIILNEDILKTMNPTKRKAFENFGAVGIDASVIGGDKGVNVRAFFPLIKDFIQDKCNIFIFPEGRLAIRKDLDLHSRFQEGVASLINKILGIKKEVRVVPVAFAYGKGDKKDLNAMSIGTPIMIKRNGEATTITKGDIEKNPESLLYNFFNKNKNTKDIIITSEGKPVTQNNVSKYIKTILCENLEINTNIAEHKLKNPILEGEIEIR